MTKEEQEQFSELISEFDKLITLMTVYYPGFINGNMYYRMNSFKCNLESFWRKVNDSISS